MLRFAITASVLFAIATPVSAQIVFVDDLSKFTPTKADQFKSDWDKVECRAEDVLGSRLERHQVCLTKWQWWSYEQDAKQRVNEWQRIGFASH